MNKFKQSILVHALALAALGFQETADAVAIVEDTGYLQTPTGVCGWRGPCWQSMTPTQSGTLMSIYVPVCNTGGGFGRVRIYEGNCPEQQNCDTDPGLFLGESIGASVDTPGDECDLDIPGGNAQYTFTPSEIVLTAGVKYTFEISGVTAYNDLRQSSNYEGGRDFHPSLNANSVGDVPFRTFLQVSTVVEDTGHLQTPIAGCSFNAPCWQSFTPTQSGALEAIYIPVCNTGGGFGSVRIYEGSCPEQQNCDINAGILLGESRGASVDTPGDECNLGIPGGNGRYTFMPSQIILVAGVKYTFEVIDVAAYTDFSNNNYEGGRDFHPSLNANSEGDVPFRTFLELEYSPMPTGAPSPVPTALPSAPPSSSVGPSVPPSAIPSSVPSAPPSASVAPSASPSESRVPSVAPSTIPSSAPSATPSLSWAPTLSPSESGMPSVVPSVAPSSLRTAAPSSSLAPSLSPSDSGMPSVVPSVAPSNLRTAAPSLSEEESPTVAPITDTASSAHRSRGRIASVLVTLAAGIAGVAMVM